MRDKRTGRVKRTQKPLASPHSRNEYFSSGETLETQTTYMSTVTVIMAAVLALYDRRLAAPRSMAVAAFFVVQGVGQIAAAVLFVAGPGMLRR
jgi:hypothetical protein